MRKEHAVMDLIRNQYLHENPVLEANTELSKELILSLDTLERDIMTQNVAKRVEDGSFSAPLRSLQKDADSRLLLRLLHNVGKVV